MGRLRLLFGRYASAHLRLRVRPRPIQDARGRQAGHLDLAELEGGRLRVRGWVTATEVTLLAGGGRASGRPTLPREDVARVTGGPAAVGFDLSLPCGWETLRDSAEPGLQFDAPAGAEALRPIVLDGLEPWRGLLQQGPRFLLALARALPSLLGWQINHSPRHKARIKRLFGLESLSTLGGPLDATLLKPATLPSQTLNPPCDVTVLVPVHNAFDLLPEMLDRLRRHSDLDLRLILIEDCSTDPRVRGFLRDWATQARGGRLTEVTLIENASNLGFIGSVNLGLARALAPGGGSGPVVLLNSDAFLPQGWTSRLLAPLLADPKVASATPMSNDAEIFSVPALCRATALRPGQGDAIDRVAAGLTPGAGLAEVPTGVGFCMAMARAWLTLEPVFDAGFGRGYGEEVDWCQKTRARGGRHVGVPQLFVEHRGGASFGSEEKQLRVQRNNALIARRYPDYDREVQQFIAADPMATARLAQGLAWAGSLGAAVGPEPQPGPQPEPVPIYLAHSLGGGAEQYLQERIAGDIDRIGAAVVLRVGGPQRWQIELVTAQGRTVGTTDDFDLVERLLAALPRRELVYSCGVGDPDPLTLPAALLRLKGPQDRVEMLFHDFFPLSPSYTLLDADGVYRSPPLPGAADRGPDDPAHVGRRPDGRPVPLADWQAAWAGLAEQAQVLRVFSADSAAQVAAVWPQFAARISVTPHRLRVCPARVPPTPGPRPVIGVLGNIGFQKGAAVLQDLARQLAPRRGTADEIGLVLVGTIDPFYPLPGTVTITGPYLPGDIAHLVRAHRISHWLIPSIWPETFSYTTHEALATGLPVLAFALGAQGAAVAAAPNGRVLPLPEGGDPAAEVIAAVAQCRKGTA